MSDIRVCEVCDSAFTAQSDDEHVCPGCIAESKKPYSTFRKRTMHTDGKTLYANRAPADDGDKPYSGAPMTRNGKGQRWTNGPKSWAVGDEA